ncbi:hypothetical protein GUJ93_ZPchr0001g32889 [Zizania palustris]|uniref:Uncharacterized protein n=1 Tax=Zizania palustris TaxID=103762 RepID=A0A8J5VU54_ZIZPA|nr:hypothetical protein GUJ93_ZPchr0001g32889 [Zizania palustris]
MAARWTTQSPSAHAPRSYIAYSLRLARSEHRQMRVQFTPSPTRSERRRVECLSLSPRAVLISLRRSCSIARRRSAQDLITTTLTTSRMPPASPARLHTTIITPNCPPSPSLYFSHPLHPLQLLISNLLRLNCSTDGARNFISQSGDSCVSCGTPTFC